MPGQSWAEQGQVQCQPDEYVRKDTAKLLTLFCPNSGELRARGGTAVPNAVLHPWLQQELTAMLDQLPAAPPVTDAANGADYGPWQPHWDLPECVIDDSPASRPSKRHWVRAGLSCTPATSGTTGATRPRWRKPPGSTPPLSLALCLAGENPCPPEDVGGAPGYQNCLDALVDPAHRQHDEFNEWIGRLFDPAAFDVAEINQWLNQIES